MKRAVRVFVAALLTGGSVLGQGPGEHADGPTTPSVDEQTAVPRSEILRILTETRLTVRFDRTPAREVFRHLQQLLGIEIVGGYEDDPAGHGIDPGHPILLQVAHRPALDVLELVLEQCSVREACTWQVRRGFVEVGTKERLSAPAAQEVRAYPVRDLLLDLPSFPNAPRIDITAALSQAGAGSGTGGGGSGGSGGGGGGGQGGSIIDDPGDPPPRAAEHEQVDDLILLITQTIEPDAWEVNDWASIRYYSGALVVRAPGFIHRQIGGFR